MAALYEIGKRVLVPDSAAVYEVTRRMTEPGDMRAANTYQAVQVAGSPASRGRKVLLKNYNDPSSWDCPWFHNYYACQKEVKKRLSEISDYSIQVHDVFILDGVFHLAIDWVEGRELTAEVEDLQIKWDPNRAMSLMRVFVYALGQVHARGIIHQDLKLDNVWCQSMPHTRLGVRAKIGDFDWSFLADKMPPWGDKPQAGTLGYRSPEHILQQRPTDKSDIFTTGVMMYLVATGMSPFGELFSKEFDGNESYEAEILKIVRRGVPSPFNISSKAKDLGRFVDNFPGIIHWCMNPDPAKRPTAAQLHAALLAAPRTSPEPVILPSNTSSHQAGGLHILCTPGNILFRARANDDIDLAGLQRLFNLRGGAIQACVDSIRQETDKSWALKMKDHPRYSILQDGDPLSETLSIKQTETIDLFDREAKTILANLKLLPQ